ncbi:MAG: MFS transporter [Chlamydiota bacterium]
MQSRIPFTHLWSACLGNLFEHYDTALYGFLSPFLAPLFFPNKDPITALILTYAIIPLGMLARPFGALVFGKIGDIYGRQHALFLSLSGMALISLGIAICPTYAQAGILAPLLLCLSKILQNFLAAGEIMGGAIFLLENSPKKKHDLLSSLYNASTIGGILLASAAVFCLSYFHKVEEGWRLLYLFGSITALFGCFVRKKLPQDTTIREPSFLLTNIAQTLWRMRAPLCMIALTSGFSYATYSMSLILMNGFVPLVSSLTKESMLALNSLLLVLDFATLPLFGWLASKMQRQKLMLYSSLMVVITALPLSMFLSGAHLLTVILVRLCFVLFGVAFFAPFHAWAQDLIPKTHRYLIISFGYSLGSQLLGGPTAAISLWIFKKTGIVSSISWYWAMLGLASTLVIAFTTAKKRQPA